MTKYWQNNNNDNDEESGDLFCGVQIPNRHSLDRAVLD